MNVNTVTLIGRVAAKPQLKTFARKDGKEGFRCWFNLAVTRLADRGADRDEQRTSFIPIVAWGEAAKRHAQYLNTGTEVAITGELVVDSIRNEDNSFRTYFHVQAKDVQYGAPSLKNASAEVIGRRKAAMEARLAEISGATVPMGTPLPSNPFTGEGTAPAV